MAKYSAGDIITINDISERELRAVVASQPQWDTHVSTGITNLKRVLDRRDDPNLRLTGKIVSVEANERDFCRYYVSIDPYSGEIYSGTVWLPEVGLSLLTDWDKVHHILVNVGGF